MLVVGERPRLLSLLRDRMTAIEGLLPSDRWIRPSPTPAPSPGRGRHAHLRKAGEITRLI